MKMLWKAHKKYIGINSIKKETLCEANKTLLPRLSWFTLNISKYILQAWYTLGIRRLKGLHKLKMTGQKTILVVWEMGWVGWTTILCHTRSETCNKVVESYQVWSNVRWDTFDASSSPRYTVKLRQKSSKHVLSMKSEKWNLKWRLHSGRDKNWANTVTDTGRIWTAGLGIMDSSEYWDFFE